MWKELTFFFLSVEFLKILARYRRWQAHAGVGVRLVCCDNDFCLPRRSVKQMLCSCMKKKRYSICYVEKEKEGEGERGERCVMFGCEESRVSWAPAGICRWKDNKGISSGFSRAFGPKTECLFCFLHTNCSNSWMPLSIAWAQQTQEASVLVAKKHISSDKKNKDLGWTQWK